MEETILDFWDAEKIFERSIAQRPADKLYSFYDGPPFATGTPHYGHIVASAIKDTVPRYWTMKGYRVERKWGWDCHGLPIENIAEKELGITHKKEILEMGVEKFNDTCRSKVLEYVAEWKKVMRRFGRFADMENAYKTMDLSYMESVWWVFKELWDKGLIYESYRTMHICPRCETTLSQSEVAEGYMDVKDLAVTAKFELVDEPGTFVLAWTTTPWTLPGNVALAVGKDIDYVTIEKKDDITGTADRFIIAKDCLKTLFGEEGYVVIEEFTGEKLIGKSYTPPFDYYLKDETLENREKGWKIYHADFITTDTGTGIAHEAPAFGEEDMELGKKESLPFVQHVDMDGAMKKEVVDFTGLVVKSKDDAQSTDIAIIKYLAHKGLLFSKEKYEHEYPSCWRCDTPLIYYAKPSWFIRMSDVHDALVANNESIKWVPEHIKEGRFGEWLRGAKDWAISRERYWGTPLPIWVCEKCDARKVISSLAELTELSGKTLEDIHKPYIDDVTFVCVCGATMKRTPEAMDVWFDSGAMPLAQFSYPHSVNQKDKKNIETGKYFPADYICEAIDQTRGWFYTLHAVATLLHRAGKVHTGNAYKNVICLGHVLDGDGKKMSKSRGNVIDPFEMFDQFGADQLRWFFFSINQPGLPKRFDLKGMRDVQNRVFRMLWNSYSFFTTYTSIDNWMPKDNAVASKNILDMWIISELQILIQKVDYSLASYDIYPSTKSIESFIDNLSNWYIRRSRDRFWKNENDGDKENAYQTLYDVLVTLSKVMAPFTPFLSEEIYKNLTDEESVHLADYPVANETSIDKDVREKMMITRNLVVQGLQKRSGAGIKVRQPLALLSAKIRIDLPQEYKDIIKEELNVKDVVFDILESLEMEEDIVLDMEITPELKLEGEAREIIRAIQEGRKKAGFNVEDRISLGSVGKEKVFEKFSDMITKEVLATKTENVTLTDAEYTETVSLDGEDFSFSLKRI